jgi:hypothetical protein
MSISIASGKNTIIADEVDDQPMKRTVNFLVAIRMISLLTGW